MKLGCSSSAYDMAIRAGAMELQSFVRTCAEDLDVDGVEFLDAHFPTVDALYLRDLKRTCTELGLTIASIAVTGDLGGAEGRRAEMERVKRWCDVAAYLGAPIVRVHAGRLDDGEHALDAGRIVGLFRKVFGERSPDRRRVWSDVAWALRECSDSAAERGIVLALSNDDAAGAIAANAVLLWQLVRDVGSPWLRSAPDAGRLRDHSGLDLPTGQAVLACATLREIRDDGSDAATHWPEVLRMLQLARFRGYLVIDYGGAAGSIDAVRRGARYLRGAMHLLGRQALLQEQAEPPANGTASHDQDRAAITEAPVVEEAATVVARALRR